MFHSDGLQDGAEGRSAPVSVFLRCLAGVRGLFQLTDETTGNNPVWYAGLTIHPGAPGTAETAAFTGQLSRLQTALSAAGEPESSPRVTAKMRNAARRMLPVQNAGGADSHTSA